MAPHWSRAALDFQLGRASKDGRVYVAAVDPCVAVQTPGLTLLGSLDGQHATLAVPAAFADWLRDVDARVVDLVCAEPEAVLGKAVCPDFLRDNARSFVDGDAASPTATVKVRVSEALAAFDAQGQAVAPGDLPDGCRARAVLELARVTFGRAQWGAMWRLAQVRELPSECPIEAGPEPDAAEPEPQHEPDAADPADPADPAEPDAAEDLADDVGEYA